VRKAQKTMAKAVVGCKALSSRRIMTVLEEEVPANFVPAAAVRRGGRALSGITGRKGSVGCIEDATNESLRPNLKDVCRTPLLEFNRG
jgi:hypothetical protein